MTPLRKAVHRVTAGTVHGGRRLIVTMHPGDVLGFREERTRREYFLSIGAAYTYAVRLAVAARRVEKLAARKARLK